MPRKKRQSRVLEKGQLRALKIKAIDPDMNFGNHRSLAILIEQVETLQNRLNEYNTAIAMIDDAKLEIDNMEKVLADLLDQLLAAIAVKYGNDSREYQMAGGTTKSERIRKSSETRKAKAAGKKKK